jgi:fatty acid desaturase
MTRTRRESQRTAWSIGRANAILILLSVCGSAYASWLLYAAPIGSVRVVQFWLLFLLSGLLFNRLMLVFHRTHLADVGPVMRVLAHAS